MTTYQWSNDRHVMRSEPRSVGAGWSAPVTVCGLVVSAGGVVSHDGRPTCVVCRDVVAGRTGVSRA